MGVVSSEKPKKKHRKGLWSPDEDQRLRDYILRHGNGCWSSVPKNAGLQRNGKSCRLRWINYLRPGLKRGAFSVVEEETVLALHKILGNKWSQIAHHLPGRTDNEVKNYWHSYLKKRVAKMDDEYKIQSSQFHDHHSKPSQTEAEAEGDQKLSLPKILFADWLSFDNQDCFKNGSNHVENQYSSNLGDAFFDGVEDMLPSPFKLDSQFPLDYFPQEFSIYHDHMNTF